ncbi:probable E3 ubiquitin-protein ligase DTX3 isoform X2 [Ptychodera flava]|uniref:probable E3 ubiquitin-protein ligase DTX3 isoform X2 n=1 Tax=Ptychodera flava TaxID=63121 RepID=UPI00396A1719
MSNIDSISQDDGIGDCTICADDNVKLKKLLCCGFLICEACAGKHFASNSKCPSCLKKAVVLVDGNQPRSSKMEYQVDSSPLPGYSSFGTIVIDYFFPDGIQEAEHPNPGKPYTGTMRRAYLPNNPEGRDVLDLLEKAFNKRLLFTIGTSHTTGQTDCVVWNDVHHKTSRTGGPTSYGYPDSDYLRRVKDELAAKGIK